MASPVAETLSPWPEPGRDGTPDRQLARSVGDADH